MLPVSHLLNSIQLLAVSFILYLPASIDPDKNGGKCTGSANCRACKTCNYCKHCNNGGSCGVCAGGSSSSASAYFNSSSSSSRPSYSGSSINSQGRFLVKADNVDVRSGPGTTYAIIDGLSRGEIVNGSSGTSSWVEIKFVVSVNEITTSEPAM